MGAEQVIIPILPYIILGGMLIGALGIAAGLLTTRWRIKHGYPLETSWGKPLHPSTASETTERVRLLTTENAQLRAELGSIKDRLATVERIVTDDGHRVSAEIERLRGPAN